MTERRWWDRAQARVEGWQIGRVRAAYRRGTKVERAPGPPFAAMVAEMRAALHSATAQGRSQADEDVLYAIFFGPWGPAVLRTAARWWPGFTLAVLTRASPSALRFLVGPIEVAAPNVNRVPRCAFRAEGGSAVCQEVCRTPTEAFTARHQFPVRLVPDRDGPGCTWTWGEAR